MERFAFIIHPVDVRRDLSRKFPVAAYAPVPVLEAVSRHIPPMVTAHIVGVKSETGAEAEGWFIGCPLTPNQLLTFPPEVVYAKLQRCAEMAEGLGAKIIGLGALTSVVGDGGITLASRVNIAVTTGNSYTVATAVEGAKKGAAEMGICISEATVAVVGAAGSIGHTCALMLAPQAKKIVLVGRHPEKLKPVADEVLARGGAVEVTGDIATGLKDADVIVTVTSAADAVILPEMLKKGAVVVDVARPRDVSVRVAKERNDVLVIEGGLIQIPGQMRLPKTNSAGVERPGAGEFSFGFPKGTAYACMSETMLLALDGRYENFTLGKEVSVQQAEEMLRLAKKHGFALGGFRSFEKEVTSETIAAVRKAAGRDAKETPAPTPATATA